MDAGQFDRMTRTLASGATRRGVVASVAAAAAAVVGLGSRARDVAAVTPATCRKSGRYCTRNSHCCNQTCLLGKRAPRGLRNTCACLAPDLRCGGVCRQVLTDTSNCGACGVACDAGWTCEEGECVEPPFVPCTDLADNEQICAATTDGQEIAGLCGLIETRATTADQFAPVACSSDDDCADTFGPCGYDDVTCFCGVGVAIGSALPYTDAQDYFEMPAVCGAITSNETRCAIFNDLPVIKCSEVGGPCLSDNDCCFGGATCSNYVCGAGTAG
jgi:hypothetical protein